MTIFVWVFCVIAGLIIVVMGIGVLCGGAPFVPTRREWIDEALKLAQVGKNDVLVDLGSGNGEVLRMAIKHGAKRAVGYEINPLLACWSRVRLKKLGEKIEIRSKDFFRTNLPNDTTVIYLFQVDKVLKKIPEFLLQQKAHLKAAKLRVIVFGFKIPDREVIRESNGMRLYEF
ncbi:hypothetical protein FWF74_04045 [Candidatus Saccharibacteria bacterium]|nr:hypothetical protein [Candidatus Saccharibacteria bacterium]MCL1962772.1 hypothetical protein [Candidatus Saccharibacteria bacterium]